LPPGLVSDKVVVYKAAIDLVFSNFVSGAKRAAGDLPLSKSIQAACRASHGKRSPVND
jgi:hypothetical protein